MKTDIKETTEQDIQKILDVLSNSKRDYKLVKELWDFCILYPNDEELGKNLRLFILTKTMNS